MIEQIVELFRKADESAWVEPESGGYVCIDGHFDVAIIDDWLAEIKAQAVNEFIREHNEFIREHNAEYRKRLERLCIP